MKKGILLLSLILMGLSASSQDFNGWKFGVSFDPMVTWLSPKENIKSDGSRMGFDFSLLAKRYFHERYAFYTGISLMNMGGKLVGTNDNKIFGEDAGQIVKLQMQYLAIPVGIKLQTAEYGMFSYYFDAGLYTGVRVGGSAYYADNQEKHSINSKINTITAGTQLGAGLTYALGGGTYIEGGLKFNYGFVDVLSGHNNAHSTGLGLHIGILF